jgi:hypothetical protein
MQKTAHFGSIACWACPRFLINSCHDSLETVICQLASSLSAHRQEVQESQYYHYFGVYVGGRPNASKQVVLVLPPSTCVGERPHRTGEAKLTQVDAHCTGWYAAPQPGPRNDHGILDNGEEFIGCCCGRWSATVASSATLKCSIPSPSLSCRLLALKDQGLDF